MKKNKLILSLGFVLFLAACGQAVTDTPPPQDATQEQEQPAATAGDTVTEEGQGMGLRGWVRLNVEHDNGTVVSLDPLFHNDTDTYFDMVFAALSSQLIGSNSFDGIDVVSGATYTSRGILNAVADVIAPGTFPVYPPYPYVDVTTQPSPPIYSTFGYVTAGSREAENATFPVGTEVILAHEHFPGAAGSQALVTGAFDEIAYAVSFQPGAAGFPFEYAHRWIMHTELWGWQDNEIFEPGTIVMLYTDHFPGSRFQIGIIEYYEIGTTYMLDLVTRYGLPVWDHQWFTESEIVPAGTDLGDIYEHIAGHHAGSHVQGRYDQTYSEMNNLDPQYLINNLTDEQIQELIDAGLATEQATR